MKAIFVLIVYVILLVLWGGYVAWRWMQTRSEARLVFASHVEDGTLPDSTDETAFTDLYVRTEGPRAMTYMYVSAVIVTLCLVPYMEAFNLLWRTIWRSVGASDVFATGQMFHTFIMFLAVGGFMAAVLAAAMRRYYAIQPPSLRQVIRDFGGRPS